MTAHNRFPPLRSQAELDASDRRQRIMDGMTMFAAGVAVTAGAAFALYQIWRVLE